MSKSLPRRPKTRKQRIADRRQRRREQQKVQAQIDEAIAQIVQQTVEQALCEEVTALLGRGKSERRDPQDWVMVGASCNKCHTHYRGHFYRAGYYQRSLLTFETNSQIRVPRISCVWGGMVDYEFIHLMPYGRVWFDLQERARELAADAKASPR